ncbi:hypothetical protein RISK_005075 [Rhodopirellula islandica]|uniref:Uncharacterized protein n=1 Tax=Rhodopirellula islandica TaxID=595434 RepID=A0A0J1EAZ5_RHOIS|nr:hypothetical protein RISK_005075 [Rhodopirellula islandica]
MFGGWCAGSSVQSPSQGLREPNIRDPSIQSAKMSSSAMLANGILSWRLQAENLRPFF